MTIYRIPKTRKLVLHSVIRLDDSTMNELDRLGTVEIILVPSGMHRMDAAWYGQRYPQARIVCPRGEQEQVEEVVKVHASSEDVFGRLGDDQADKNDVVGRAGEGGIREYVRIMKPTRGFYDDVHELIYLVRLESEDDTLVGSRNEQEDTSNQAGDLPRQPPADQRDQATRLARRTVAPRPHALIVCDLFFNIDPLTAGLGTRILGSAVGFGVTALGKFLVVEDKRALRKWIAQDLMRIAKGEQVRVVTVAHGRVVVGKINVLTALDDAVRTLD
ncbi:hypothetical protein HK102_008753 [Quaeritorhiza haematococci]|nr:hypothetical protein HK102_008753 [Quaeritorhiza haematococci]